MAVVRAMAILVQTGLQTAITHRPQASIIHLSLTLSQALNVAENASLVGEIAFSDADGDAVSLSIEGIDSESFYIDASNQLRFIFSPDFEDAKDIDGDNFFEIEIIASDGKDNDRQSVLVGILNLPENKFDELAIENLKME